MSAMGGCCHDRKGWKAVVSRNIASAAYVPCGDLIPSAGGERVTVDMDVDLAHVAYDEVDPCIGLQLQQGQTRRLNLQRLL